MRNIFTICKFGYLTMWFPVSSVCLHWSQRCGTSAAPECHIVSNTHQGSKEHCMIDRLNPYLSMSPWTSLLPLWDMSREEVTSDDRPVFRAYRWRPPSVRYLWEDNQLEEIDVQPQLGKKKEAWVFLINETQSVNQNYTSLEKSVSELKKERVMYHELTYQNIKQGIGERIWGYCQKAIRHGCQDMEIISVELIMLIMLIIQLITFSSWHVPTFSDLTRV